MVSAEGIAWALMSEGSMQILVKKEPKQLLGFRLKVEVKIANCDETFLTTIKEWCEKQNIQAYLCSGRKADIHRPRRCRNISIVANREVQKFVTIIKPHLLPRWSEIAQAMLDFCEYRKTRYHGGAARFARLNQSAHEQYILRRKYEFLYGLKLREKTLKKQGISRVVWTSDYFAKLWNLTADEIGSP